MKTVQIREAKACLSAVIADAEQGKPTLITRHNRPSAMVVPVSAGERLFPLERPSLADWLLAIPAGLETERDLTPVRGVDL